MLVTLFRDRHACKRFAGHLEKALSPMRVTLHPGSSLLSEMSQPELQNRQCLSRCSGSSRWSEICRHRESINTNARHAVRDRHAGKRFTTIESRIAQCSSAVRDCHAGSEIRSYESPWQLMLVTHQQSQLTLPGFNAIPAHQRPRSYIAAADRPARPRDPSVQVELLPSPLHRRYHCPRCLPPTVASRSDAIISTRDTAQKSFSHVFPPYWFCRYFLQQPANLPGAAAGKIEVNYNSFIIWQIRLHCVSVGCAQLKSTTLSLVRMNQRGCILTGHFFTFFCKNSIRIAVATCSRVALPQLKGGSTKPPVTPRQKSGRDRPHPPSSFARSDTLSASGKVLRSAGVHVRSSERASCIP